MKLGQKVRFDKHLRKRDDIDPDEIFQDWPKRTKLVERYKTIELDNEQTGIVAGKRTIPYKMMLCDWMYISPDEDRPPHFADDQREHEYKQVYLIACDMRGFYRVPEEWLEVVE